MTSTYISDGHEGRKDKQPRHFLALVIKGLGASAVLQSLFTTELRNKVTSKHLSTIINCSIFFLRRLPEVEDDVCVTNEESPCNPAEDEQVPVKDVVGVGPSGSCTENECNKEKCVWRGFEEFFEG